MATVFSTTPLYEDQADRLRAADHRLSLPESVGPIGREELLRGVWDAEALVCLLTDRIDEQVLSAGRSLKVVASVAVGYENIDIDTARRLGIRVTNTPDVLTEATADLAFALLLATARRIAEADRAVREGQFPVWSLDQPLLGIDVHGATLGIVGMGRIGCAVARRGRLGFGMRILYHNRTRNEAAERELDAECVSFDRLLADSDFISVHVPKTAETHHLFDADAFARMKPTAILINAARGSVVDESALVSALEEGLIAGAGLDVYEDEPTVHPGLLRLTERVILAPHIGSATRETRRQMVKLAVDNVLAVLAGEPPLTPVT
jgi:glyoxylate reductase